MLCALALAIVMPLPFLIRFIRVNPRLIVLHFNRYNLRNLRTILHEHEALHKKCQNRER